MQKKRKKQTNKAWKKESKEVRNGKTERTQNDIEKEARRRLKKEKKESMGRKMFSSLLKKSCWSKIILNGELLFISVETIIQSTILFLDRASF